MGAGSTPSVERRRSRLFIAALVLVGLGVLFTLRGRRDEPFARATWLSGDQDVRGTMAQDLLRRRSLPGLAPPEVRELLGPPDVGGPTTMIYDLGYMGRDPRMPFSFPMRLVIHFHAERVVAAEIDD